MLRVPMKLRPHSHAHLTIMNFSSICKEKRLVLCPGNIPLLILASEWSNLKDVAYEKIDLVLLLLQGIQAASEDKSLTPLTIQRKLAEIDEQFETNFLKRVEEVSNDLSSFMNLFEHFSNLFETSEDTSSSFLDRDCKNSVFSVFIRHCVQEYKRLTFSQLTRLHSRWHESTTTQTSADYNVQDPIDVQKSSKCSHSLQQPNRYDFTTSLQQLMIQEAGGYMKGHMEGVTSDRELGSEALQLAQLHEMFGHREEGVFALHEAIRLAQQRNNSTVLEHALGWLHKLQQISGEEALIILNRFTKNAEELKIPMLGMWGRLQQAKTQLILGQDPKKILEILMTCESDFSCIYEENARKLAQRSSMLALQGATLNYYGHKLPGVFYSQLLCHMTSCNLPSDSEGGESFALSLSCVAKHLFEIGDFEKCEGLLVCAKDYFKLSTVPFKILCKCLEETCFDRALQMGDLSAARLHLNNLVTFDMDSADYRTALLTRAEGNHQEAFDKAQTLIQRLKLCGKEHPDLLPRSHLFLADILSTQGFPAMALPHVMACMNHCEECHLSTHTAKLSLAQLQLQLAVPRDCLELVEGCLLHCQTHSSLPDRAKAYFLRAQAILMVRKETGIDVQDEVVSEVLSLLTQAGALYERCMAVSDVKKVRTLQAYLYDFIGNTDERDRISERLTN